MSTTYSVYLPNYSVGPDCYEAIPSVTARYGKKVVIIGGKTAEEHKGILTFTVEGVHPHDIAAILDADGVNVRAGNHCAQPLLDHLCTGATARASLAFYNSAADVERFINSLSTIRERMGYGR